MEMTQKFFLVLLIVFSTRFSVVLLRKFIFKNSRLDSGTWNPLRFYAYLLFGVVYFLGGLLCIYVIPPLRHLTGSILASSGVIAIVIGFAAQHALANIISAFFIAIFKPFSIGDKVKFIGKDIIGTIEDITLRHTIIKTFENKRIIIPNAIVSTEVIENANIVDETICKFFEIGIGYDSDHNKAMKIIEEEVMKHPDFFDNRTKEEKKKGLSPVKVRIVGFGESSVNLRAWVWARNHTEAFDMICDLNQSIKERFNKQGIEIPYPYRNIIHKNAARD
ncbi:MAG: mechanosensitive ion channel family protein [Candidatus Aureabacteria bacterium]|nr:mechanosensitive ion channel family protein [Candidatus Auribacterota bacterium]